MEDNILKITVDINIRIDTLLSENYDDLSRSYIQKLIKDGNVLVNNKVVKPNYKTKLNDKIIVALPEIEETEIIPENIDLDIVYDDNDVIIVNKPQGMVVHPAAGHETGTLVNGLLYHFADSLSGINGVKRPGIVHRIDKDTSGLLIICKNDNSHHFIAEQLKEHSIKRIYNALVYNNIKEDVGTIEGPIGRHPIDRKKMSINYKNGRDAVTHFKVLERYGNYTFVQLQLETGRTHQIRVHMTSKGFPLIGDPVYGPKKTSFKLNGQMLHAKVIGFIHPTTKEYMEFNSELPKQFVEMRKKLRNNKG